MVPLAPPPLGVMVNVLIANVAEMVWLLSTFVKV